jgi:hypothetical protein
MDTDVYRLGLHKSLEQFSLNNHVIHDLDDWYY